MTQRRTARQTYLALIATFTAIGVVLNLPAILQQVTP